MGFQAMVVPPDQCPRLIPVMADWLCVFPTGACCRKPSGRIRVPAAATLACVCTTPAYLDCPGYLAGLDYQEATAGAAGAIPAEARDPGV